MNINIPEPITVQLCAEDRHRLDTIITALAAILEQGRTVGTPFSAAEPEVEIPDQVSLDEVAAPEVKLDDIKRKVVELSVAGKRDTVKALVREYALNVSAIPEDKFGEVWAKLTALEG